MKQLSITLAIVLCIIGIALAADTDGKRKTSIAPLNANKAKATPVEVLRVTYPTNAANFTAQNNKIKVTVRFNADIDQGTVVAGSTVRLDFPRAANAAGQITWLNEREFFWEQSANSVFDICAFKPDCFFKLTLTDSIKSKGGHKLDGDKDNKPGGNFVHNFVYIG